MNNSRWHTRMLTLLIEPSLRGLTFFSSGKHKPVTHGGPSGKGGKIGKRKIMNPQTSCVLLKSTIQVNRSFLFMDIFGIYAGWQQLTSWPASGSIECGVWTFFFFKCSSPSKVCLTFSFTKKGEVKSSRDLEFESNFKWYSMGLLSSPLPNFLCRRAFQLRPYSMGKPANKKPVQSKTLFQKKELTNFHSDYL